MPGDQFCDDEASAPLVRRSVRVAISILSMTFTDSPISALPAETQADFESSYLHMRFRGGRFERSVGMPMAAMSELTYLNDLIIEVARVLWRRQKGVKRAHDYPDEPVLRVERFAKGSAIPLIDRDGLSSVLTGDPYDQSRDLVEKAFWGIVDQSELPEEFPLECVDQLRRFGKTLREEEAAEFLQKDAGGVWVERRYTKQIRSQFWTSFDTPTQQRIFLVGQVDSLARKSSSFVFERVGGQKLDAKFQSPAMWDDLHAALGKSSTHPFCRLEATVEVDYVKRIRKILLTHRVEVIDVDPAHWSARFLELASYADDWMPGASAVTADSLERTDHLLRLATNLALPEPTVFASFDGGTNLVWDLGDSRTTIYIEPDTPYEVENVPNGPLAPFETADAEAAVLKAKGYVNG